MKKFFAMIFIFAAALTLAACGKKEFKQDGEFKAFEITAFEKAPMITWVTVTVKDGKITNYKVDALQGKIVSGEDEEGNSIYTTATWNAESKQQLGYRYGMHGPEAGMMPITAEKVEAYKTWLTENNKLEWFEQVGLAADKWLKDGVESIKVVDGKLDGLAGATIDDGGYVKLAKEAVQNARDGKFVEFEVSMNYGAPEVVWATATVEKGKVKTLVIDTLQSTISPTEGVVWNTKTKQEQAYLYAMHGPEAGMMPMTPEKVEAYKAWLTENEKLEWFEQVALIAADVVANGKPSKALDAEAGVSVTSDHYYSVINKVYASIK